ncbi:MAG: type VI secretion system protein TssA [Thermoguttaceae bacterium]|jgi:type VI secretion system protein ImpA
MGSPSVLDFDRLLSPIPGECPAGVALKEDYSPGSPYYAIKDARSAARAAERSMIWGGDDVSGGDRADWRPVVELGIEILAERSKDLEVAAWLTEALVRRHGYAGLRDGFRLLRALVENFWDDLYPRPDEDGIQTRVAPLTGLNGEEGDGVLVGPIANVPITTPGSYRAMSIADYRQAIDLERIDDAQKRQQRIDHGGVSLQMFETAVSETPLEHFRDLRDDLRESIDEYQKLTSVLEEKCGQDSRGYPLAPPSSSIRNVLDECCEHLGNVTKHLFPDEALAPPPDGQPAGAAAPAGAAKRVETREEAFQSLLQIAAFFKRTEPHSPVSYALEQAVRWGKLPLPELLNELIADQGSREQLFKLVGIQSPEKP